MGAWRIKEMVKRNQDKALIQVTEMRQELAQNLPQQSVGSDTSSIKQRGLFACLLLSPLIEGVSLKD
jgi:hypothetical protein